MGRWDGGDLEGDVSLWIGGVRRKRVQGGGWEIRGEGGESKEVRRDVVGRTGERGESLPGSDHEYVSVLKYQHHSPERPT